MHTEQPHHMVFANAYTLLKDISLLEEAAHGFAFLEGCMLGQKNGGVYWSVNYDGTPAETLKHTYNQAFSIYALSSYYEASRDREALDMAYQLYDLIEGRCETSLDIRKPLTNPSMRLTMTSFQRTV